MERGYYGKAEIADIGTILVAMTRHGLCRVSLGIDKRRFLRSLPADVKWIEDVAKFARLTSKLVRFASGNHSKFAERVDLRTGTPFQQRVWQAIATIPWGETRSYAWLAHAVERPRAFRAAANACGANPLPIIIPCHRVIASDGTIGGFSGPLALKRKLLSIEGIHF